MLGKACIERLKTDTNPNPRRTAPGSPHASPVARTRAWRQVKLGERPPYPWTEATKRCLTETRKRSKARDDSILGWFNEHLKDYDVQAITREVVQELRAPITFRLIKTNPAYGPTAN